MAQVLTLLPLLKPEVHCDALDGGSGSDENLLVLCGFVTLMRGDRKQVSVVVAEARMEAGCRGRVG